MYVNAGREELFTGAIHYDGKGRRVAILPFDIQAAYEGGINQVIFSFQRAAQLAIRRPGIPNLRLAARVSGDGGALAVYAQNGSADFVDGFTLELGLLSETISAAPCSSTAWRTRAEPTRRYFPARAAGQAYYSAHGRCWGDHQSKINIYYMFIDFFIHCVYNI